jgi:hypothetical protein
MIMKMTFKQVLACAAAVMFLGGSIVSAAADPASKDKAEGATQKADKPVKVAGKEGAKGAAAPVTEEPVDPTGGLQSFCKMLPVGQKNAGVKIPSFTDGVPTSIIISRTMTRIDDENMAMEGMDIKLFDQRTGRSKDLSVRMKTGNYHMPTQLLNSNTRSRVERMDFTLDGDTLTFDPTTQQGKMTGNVEMVIFDAATVTGSKPEDEKAKKGKSGAENAKTAPQNEKPKAEGATKAGNKEEK